jgi:parallel beta-helix repeat protein
VVILVLLGGSGIPRVVPAASKIDTIYIRADGHVDPSTAPIVNVGNAYYTFTEQIAACLVVERDDVVIDGANHVLRHPDLITPLGYLQERTGILVEGHRNVTITRLGVQWFKYGVQLIGSQECQLTGNHFYLNANGTRLVASTGNTLDGNLFESTSFFGVLLESGSSDNIIHFNNISGGSVGLRLDTSSNGNTIVQNDFLGVQPVVSVVPRAAFNTWNTTYTQGGGNYWQYQCPAGDFYGGANQDVYNQSDGICDAWKQLEHNGTSYIGYDYYPLVNPVTDTPTIQWTRIPTRITITTTHNEYCIDDPVVISGRVTQVADDTPLFGVTVTITGTKYGPEQATTDTSGQFTFETYWDKDGTKHVAASWAGNTTHSSATSSDKQVTITDCGEGLGAFWDCFIATATYGSAVAPEVQFLRDFRADTVLTTFTGRQFMAVFNGIYYSFSPTVASGIASHEGVRAVTRGVLFPLIRILQLGEWVTQRFAFHPDFGIVAFVLVVSALLSLAYLVPWALLLSVWRRAVIPATVVRRGRDLLMGSVGLLLVAIALQVPVVTMASGALTVLVTAGLTVLSATRVIMRRLITP